MQQSGGLGGNMPQQDPRMNLITSDYNAMPTSNMNPSSPQGMGSVMNLQPDRSQSIMGDTKPQQGILGNLNQFMMNPATAMAIGLLQPTKSGSFGEALGGGYRNLMNQKLYQQKLADAEFDKKYKAGALGINQLQALATLAKGNQGTLSTKTFKDANGKEIILNFDNKKGLLDPLGNVISPATLAEQGYSEVKKPTMAYYSGETPATIKAKEDLQLKLGIQESNLDYLNKDVFPQLQTAKTYRNRVKNIMEVIDAGGMTDEGGGIFSFGQEFMSFLGIDKKSANVNEVAQAFQRRFAPELRVPGSGATTDYEMRMYLSAFPSLQMTSGGRAILMRVADTLADRASFVQAGIDKKLQSGDVSGIRTEVTRLGRLAEEKFAITTDDLQAIKGAVDKGEEERLRMTTGYGKSGVKGKYSF